MQITSTSGKLASHITTLVEPVVSGRIISEDGLVHSKYSSMTAVTGRLAAEDPNAQNWPKRKHREVRAIFFAMITLAVAAAFQTLASQLSDITGGEDGLTFKVPELLSPSFEPFETEVLGVLIDGKLITYYLLFVTAVVLVLGFRKN